MPNNPMMKLVIKLNPEQKAIFFKNRKAFDFIRVLFRAGVMSMHGSCLELYPPKGTTNNEFWAEYTVKQCTGLGYNLTIERV